MPDQRDLATTAVLALPRFVGATVLFHTAVAERLGVTPTELHCLHLLHGGADSPTELARLLGMTTGAFTRLPDRMAELAELYAPLAGFFGERLARLDHHQLAALADFLTDGCDAAERQTAELPNVTRAISN